MLILLFCFYSGMLRAASPPADSALTGAVVFVEGYDESGQTLRVSPGLLIKPGFVAINYHAVAGMHSVAVFKQGDSQQYPSNGYLSVDEKRDLVIISAPGLKGQTAMIWQGELPEEGTSVQVMTTSQKREINLVKATIKGQKELNGTMMPQLKTNKDNENLKGPVFYNGKVLAFVTAGYRDDFYYSYIVPAERVRRLSRQSFIIKAYNSFPDEKPLAGSYLQKALMESLTRVLWVTMEDAVNVAARKPKKILIDVYTDWNGWSKLMSENTYGEKRIIRFINENFYAVRLDANHREPIQFGSRVYNFLPGNNYHELAYSLLQGKMEYPSTVFLDESANMLTVIPGYMEADQLEVVLHYFVEGAYRNKSQSFEEYSQAFRSGRNNR